MFSLMAAGIVSGPQSTKITCHLHGFAVKLDDIELTLRNALCAEASYFNAAQGRAEQAEQIQVIAALIERVIARRKWTADAIVGELNRQRYHAI
ncbi:hypothetical protein [Bradyrhizobium sp. ORS 86]|uniref:hypothetical protein n=1 Tax=Bradyrhizobium sp. ORS 86 TaxID=1685970 RepID=UPI00388CF6F7